jgi:hypothetical protein
VFGIEHGRMRCPCIDATHGEWLSTFTRLVGLRIGSMGVRRGGLRNQAVRTRNQRDA